MRTTVVIAILALQILLTTNASAQVVGMPVVDRMGFGGMGGCQVPGCTDPGCAAKAANGCDCPGCGRLSVYAEADYLLWWGKGKNMPPLITNGPLGPGTLNFFGGQNVGQELQNGGRITLGSWLDQYSDTSVNITFSALVANPHRFSGASPAFSVLANPFVNALGAEDAALIASPGVTSGSADGVTELDYIGLESFLKYRLHQGRGYAMDFISGFNFNRVDDAVRLSSSSTIIFRPPTAPGTRIDTLDVFDTQNKFYGSLLGLVTTVRRGCFTMRTGLKFSLGSMRQTLFVDGRTVVTPPGGGPAVVNGGGLYALPTNMGVFSRNRWAYVPEFQFSLAYDVNDNLQVGLGYNFIWWNRMLLAGDQIDRDVNLSQAGGGVLIGPAVPSVTFVEDDYWLQGATINLNWNY